MNTIQTTIRDHVAILTLDRGRSNAMNAEMVAELTQMAGNIQADENIAGMILTGKENFFSAGLDLIELYDYNETQIRTFWMDFLHMVKVLASFKKPFVSAITGHSPAGGCVLALCADYRIMAEGKYIIGLNEVPVGLIVPDSIFELYAFWLGRGPAYQSLMEGKLFTVDEARQVGLVNETVGADSILTAAGRRMQKYIQMEPVTWQQTKLNLRAELIAKLGADQTPMLEAMLKQWWTPSTRSILQTIIRNLQKK